MQSLSLDSFFKCQINANEPDAHILKDPILLPCGYTACKECVLDVIQANNRLFKCNFDNCQLEHQILDIDQLGRNHLVAKVLTENIKYLSNDLLKKFEIEFEHFKDTNSLNENSTKIETIFEFIEGDILIRVESLKNELENLHNDLITTIRSIKEKFLKEFLNEFEHKKANSENLISSMQRVNQMNESSSEILKQNMYKCQEYLIDLKKFDTNLNKRLNQVSFRCSNWMPITANVGSIEGTSNLFTIANAVTPNVINLSCCIKQTYGICNFKDRCLFLTSPEENKVYVLDDNYHCVKSCSSVGGRHFSRPYSLCSDGQANIYLCDYGNNRILIIDNDFEEIRKVVGKQGSGHGEFSGPIDIAYSNDQLFVLDQMNQRVQVLSKRGEFLNEIVFTDETYSERMTRIGVTAETLVVGHTENLFIYDFDGELLQTIKMSHVNSFYVDENYLLTVNTGGKMCLYEKPIYKETNGGFSMEVERRIQNFEYDVAFTCLFNGHLIVSLGDNASLAVF